MNLRQNMPHALVGKGLSSAPGQAVPAILLILAALLLPLLNASPLVTASYLSALPAGSYPSGFAVDAGGNVLIAGTQNQPGQSSGPNQAFVAKLSPDGQSLIYYVVLGDVGLGATGPVALDASGSLYITGGTSSSDFPTTPGALQTSFSGGSSAGFVVKLDPAGNTMYSTLFYAASGQSTAGQAIAVNAAGEAFVTGRTVGGNFPTTPSTIHPATLANTSFMLRLSAAADRLIYSVGGIGGNAIAIDSQNNAYVAGFSFDSNGSDVPVTSGAYQTKPAFTVCGETQVFVLPCEHQYAAKLNPTGENLIFCSFVTGSSQDLPSAIAVDATGSVYLAGSTDSSDYPTTAGALETTYPVVPAPPILNDPIGIATFVIPLAATGYITKLSPDGSALIYSTFLGGSQQDAVSAIALDPSGNVTFAAQVQSPDFPGLPSAPQRCLPDRLHYMAVVGVLDSTGTSITAESLIEGASSGGGLLKSMINPQGGVDVLTTGPFLATIPSVRGNSSDPIACITDAFDFAQAGLSSPGQLLTIFGSHFDGTNILVNGVAAPLLYASKNQINFVVPYQQAPQGQVTIQLLSGTSIVSQRSLPIAAINPSLAIGGITAYPTCQGQTPLNSVYATVQNPDGSLNSCENPATNGSQVSLFVNGVGQTPPTITDVNNNIVKSVVSSPGTPLGVWQIGIQLQPAISSYTALRLSVGATPVREQNVPVWIQH